MSLGRIVVDLLAKTGSFETDINRSAKLAARRAKDIDKAFESAGRAIGTSMRGIASSLLGAVGVTLTVGAAFESLKHAIDIADETRDLSIRLGESTETISGLRYAAQQTGTDMDTLAKGMKILAKNAADALDPTSQQAKVFEALGIKVTDTSGNLKKLGELIPEVADKFKGLQDGTTKAALAQALFGKSGLELTEFLNQGADGLKTMADRARDLGIIIDSKTATAADNFNDKLSDLKAATTGLATKVASDLLPELDKLVEWAVAFVKDGKNSAEIAHEIAAGLRDMADVGSDLKELIGFLGQVRDLLAQIEKLHRNNSALNFANGGSNPVADYLHEKFPGLYKPLAGGHPDFSNVQHGGPDFSGVTGGASTLSANGPDAKKLGLALGGVGGGGKGGGKSEAQREADQLAAAYKRLEDSLKEQIALHGDVSEVAKVRYDIENGELSKLSQAQKDHLLALAAEKDAQEAHDKLVEQGKALIESLLTPTEELNKKRKEAADLLAAGAISQAEYNKAIAAYQDPGQKMLEDLDFELEMLNKTNAARATSIQLRGMDSEQVKKYGDAILEANQKLEEMHKLADFADGVRAQFSDLFVSIVDGSKSAGDALKDFFNNIAAMITRMIAERWVQQIFGEYGTTGQGTSGGGLIGSIFSMFGGGHAYGGPAMAGASYLVGEQGPELFIPRTSGVVVPAQQTKGMVGGSNVVNNAFYLPQRYTPQTQSQINQKTGAATRLALARN